MALATTRSASARRPLVDLAPPPGHARDVRADLLVIATDADWHSGIAADIDRTLRGALAAEVRRTTFRGRVGETVVVQTHGQLSAHVLLVGIGDAAGAEPWLRLADTAVHHARELKTAECAVVLPPRLAAAAVETLVSGLYLAQYRYDRLKSEPSPLHPEHVTLLTHDSGHKPALKHGTALGRATCYARDLINTPAAMMTPADLAAEAQRVARAQNLHLRVFEERELRRRGFGALLGVAQGSVQPPRFIELIYRPRARGVRSVALVGKGITFDSGGLSLKPAEAMQAQKRDMAGGAVVLAALSIARDLEYPVEVRGYIPATENMPGGGAIKPGDVVRAHNGTTIEVLNTDAEGRLVLADALSFAAAAHPDVLIDLGTLTAAVRAALGTRYAAVMGTDADTVRALIAAAQSCGENLWELPLAEEYRREVKGHVADLKNIGDGGPGTILCGLFLREFTAAVPWAHIDFSSTVVTDRPFRCHPRGATGYAVRTIAQFLRALGSA